MRVVVGTYGCRVLRAAFGVCWPGARSFTAACVPLRAVGLGDMCCCGFCTSRLISQFLFLCLFCVHSVLHVWSRLLSRPPMNCLRLTLVRATHLVSCHACNLFGQEYLRTPRRTYERCASEARKPGQAANPVSRHPQEVPTAANHCKPRPHPPPSLRLPLSPAAKSLPPPRPSSTVPPWHTPPRER